MKSIRLIGIAIAGLALASTASAQSSDPISRSAAVYATYQSDVSDVKNNPMTSAKDIDSALENLGGHNPDKLSKGWIAYSALIASQDPEYRAAVKDIENFYGRDALTTGLRNDARYARRLAGGDNAVSSALGATEADSRRLNRVSQYVKDQAYSLQAFGWAKKKIGNSSSRATKLGNRQAGGVAAKSGLVTAFSSTEIDQTLAQAGRIGSPSVWEHVSGAANAVKFPAGLNSGLTGSRKRVKYGKESVADQIATLAAYRIIGNQGTSSSTLNSAMSERKTKNCLTKANLNLNQCVAAANQQYEVPFCIGEHSLSDVGKCIGGVYQ
ncbi:MAG: hypothetical protein ACRBEQ_12650 [Hyphomonas sp.]